MQAENHPPLTICGIFTVFQIHNPTSQDFVPARGHEALGLASKLLLHTVFRALRLSS